MKIKDTIGIDVSKVKLDVHIHSSQAFSVVENEEKALKKMIKWVYKNSKFKPDEILFVFEHTGMYSEKLSRLLASKKIAYSIVPGLEIKRSLGITRGKNDKVDAERIALYAYRLRDEIQPSIPADALLKSIKSLLSLRERLVKQRAGFKASVKEMEFALSKQEQKLVIQCQKEVIKTLTKQIDKLEKEIKSIYSSDQRLKEMFNLITSIKGLGPWTAIYLMVYSDGFEKFKTWRQFASFCGIAPFPNRSGSSIRGRNKVSNLANKKLKSLLDLCAKSAIRTSHEMNNYYQKRVKEGKNERSTRNIIRNKLLARAFAVVQRKSPYVDILKYAA